MIDENECSSPIDLRHAMLSFLGVASGGGTHTG
jgi:hypothetical protein